MTHEITEAMRDGYLLSSDPARQNAAAIHAFLTRCYWSAGIPKAHVERAVANSLCFGLFDAAGKQVGLARVITDAVSFAYLCDVYVLEEHRGQGLGRALIDFVLAHPSLQGLRRIVLVTRDAHALYAPMGFKPLAKPEGYMEIHRPAIYATPPA